ncbi:MAG: hypothetical protein J6C89_03880 [Clostridia bacterium]|nr:hypothetical protein [Clostridia bacterium]
MNIKKILALVLALVMVMLMVAACGGEGETTTVNNVTTEGNATTAGKTDATDATTAGKTDATTATTEATKATTQATQATTTEAPKPQAAEEVVVYVPTEVEYTEVVCNYDSVSDAMYAALYETAETVDAINIVTGETVAVANVTRGHLYLVKADGTVVTDLGRAITYVNANRQGKKNGFSDTALMTGVKTGYWAYYFDDCTYLMNVIDAEKVNAALADYAKTVGNFGTMSIIDVTDDAITAMMGDKEVNAAELNVKFVYMTYLGDAINEATEDYSVFGLKTNTVGNITAAEDETNADGQGSTLAAWKEYNTSGSLLVTELADSKNEYFPTWWLNAKKAAANKEGLSVLEKKKAEQELEGALAKYEEFVGYYEEVVNCNLWGDDIADSPVKEYWDAATAALAEGETVEALTYTYYYDVATDTYTVFVTDNTVGSLCFNTYLNYEDFKASPEYPEVPEA